MCFWWWQGEHCLANSSGGAAGTLAALSLVVPATLSLAVVGPIMDRKGLIGAHLVMHACFIGATLSLGVLALWVDSSDIASSNQGTPPCFCCPLHSASRLVQLRERLPFEAALERRVRTRQKAQFTAI